MADTVQMPRLPDSSVASTIVTARAVRVYLFIAWVLIIHLVLPKPHGELSFDVPKEGEITRKAYIAPFTFDLLKTADEIEKERREAEKRVPYIFQYDYEATDKVIAKFRQFEKQVAILRGDETGDSLRAKTYKQLRKELSGDAISLFVENDGDPSILTSMAARIMNNGISSDLLIRDPRETKDYRLRYNIEPSSVREIDNDIILLIKDGRENSIGIGDIVPKEAAIDKERNALRQIAGKESMGAVYEIMYAWTVPNIFYLDTETSKRKEEARQKILTTRGKVVKDLEIVGRNKLVTPEIARSLYSLKVAQDNLIASERKSGLWVGLMRVLMFLLFLLPFYLWTENKMKSSRSVRTLVAFCVLILLQTILMVGTWHLINIVLSPLDTLSIYDFAFAYPLAFAPILASVLFSVEIGVASAMLCSFMLAIIAGFDFGPALIHFISGTAAALGLRNMRYRSQFFRSFLMFACTAFLSIAAYSGMKHGRIELIYILRHFALTVISGIFSLMLSMTFVWLFEKIFGLTTNLTLIELSDMNAPALKRLSMEAPGTYHHSVLVGNLTEAAAEKVGGNPLLARVIAYYHDLGKVYKPEYFIENSQNLVDTLHGKVSPRMSAIIIAAHVKQGAELAKKYALPSVVLDAIREHHGTTLISFFFDKAKEMEPDGKLMREDFCYPGPKPRSKETAILMVADSVEAASRTLGDPTPSRLRNLVEEIIQKKIEDRQLNHCELTLHELELVRESFVTVLTAMFHSRIEYPDQ